MKTNTSHITIGKDAVLTIAVVQAIAAREERSQKRKVFINKLKFWKK